MSDDNWSRQADEVEVLSSIYGDEWRVEDPVERRYSIVVKSSPETSEKSICLQVTLSDEYPSDALPAYELHAPWLRGERRVELDNRMQDTCVNNAGECVIYKFIDTVREFIEGQLSSQNGGFDDDGETASSDRLSNVIASVSDLYTRDDGSSRLDEPHSIEDDDYFDDYGFDPALHSHQPDSMPTNALENDQDMCLPEIHHGEPIFDRKSKFQGHLAAVTHKKQVDMVMDSLLTDRKIAEATHNIIAYRIDIGNGGFMSGCKDDGEIHAGSRMLHLLNMMDARNVLVVVTRWYGGIHLGPDRFKHINNCTRDLLGMYGYIKDKNDKKGPKTTTSLTSSQQQKKKKR